VRTGLEGGRELPTRLNASLSGGGEISPGLGGCKVPRVAVGRLRASGGVQVLVAWAGLRIQGVRGERSRGAETQERIGRRFGATRVGANGLVGGRRLQSGRSGRKRLTPLVVAQGDREVGDSLLAKRELIAVAGTRLTVWRHTGRR